MGGSVIAMVNAFRRIIFVIGLAVVIGSIMVTSAEDLPIIEIKEPSDGVTVYTDTIKVSGGANRGTDGVVVESVTVKGYLAKGTTSWSKDISLQLGQNEITAVATDRSGKCGMDTIYVTYIEPTPTPTNGPSPTTPTQSPPNGKADYSPAVSTPTPTLAPTPPPTGSISITTIPPGAEVYLDGSFAGNTSITLTLEDVTEGPHRVKVSKDGFCSSKTRIKHLCTGETKELIIKLEPLTGSIVVYSTPSGACVYVDGVAMNAITTCMLSEVVVGSHTIKLTKPDYFDVVKSVSVSDNNITCLHVNLTGCGYINISSNSPGANIYLDGNYTGETPKNISMVVVGNHTIKLTKLGYEDAIIRNVSVSVGRTHPVHVNLTECGYINISSDPPGANVSVDGNYMGKTPKNISTVAQGNHTIKLTKSDYFDVNNFVFVYAGKTSHLHVNLTGYGSINISSDPDGARVELDGNYMGVTPKNISKVFEGNHSIRLTKRNYKDVTEEIHVSAGNTISVSKPLSLKFWRGKEPWIPVYTALITAIATIILTFIGILYGLPFIRSKLEEKEKEKEEAKEKYLLFSVDPSYRQHLKEGDIDDKLKEVFEVNEESLTTEAKVSKIAEKQWKIVDGEMQYNIEDAKKRLDIYKKRR